VVWTPVVWTPVFWTRIAVAEGLNLTWQTAGTRGDPLRIRPLSMYSATGRWLL
jgi:hypothetical protein